MAKTLTPTEAANKRRAKDALTAYRQGYMAATIAQATAQGHALALVPGFTYSLTKSQLNETLRIAARMKGI